jgi:hypothetical protein
VTLNLLALLIFLAAAIAGAVLLKRRLPRAAAAAAAASPPVCLDCGAPARLLPTDSFICPTCRHDVRDLGLAAKNPRAFTGPFWNVVTFTAGLCALALIATLITTLTLPVVQTFSTETDIWSSAPGPYRRIVLNVGGNWIPQDRDPDTPRVVEAELYADLFLDTGEVFTLELESPSFRYRVIDTAGREVVPWSTTRELDESPFLRWLSAAGLNAADPTVRFTAQNVHTRICDGLRIKNRPVTLQPISGGFSGSTSGNSSSSGGPPQYRTPLLVIVASPLWLAGLWLFLRPRRRRPSRATRSQPSAA